MIIEKVQRELQAIKHAHKRLMKAQNQSFQLNLQKWRGQIQEVELKPRKLEYEMNLIKI